MLRFLGLRATARLPMRGDVRKGARRPYAEVIRRLEARPVRGEPGVQTPPRCAGHREKLGAVPHVEKVVHAAPEQLALARRVLPPPRAVRDTVPAVEGPWEGHQADVGHDAIVAAVPTEEVQQRHVVLRLALVLDIQQVAAGGGRRPTRNVPPPRLSRARAVLLRHRRATGRSPDCVHHRDGCEPRRVQQVPWDVLVDRDRRLTPSDASAGAAAAVVHRGPRPHRPHGADAAAQPSRGTGGGEDPPQRRGRPSSGRRKRCEARRRRVRYHKVGPWGRRARGVQRRHGRRREIYRRPGSASTVREAAPARGSGEDRVA